MKVYKYWARGNVQVPVRGQVWDIACFGSSNDSQEAALQNAQERGMAVKEAIQSGREPGGYAYSDRPLREEIKRDIQRDGTLVGVITRNSYGALILNTTDVMFIDIDVVSELELMKLPPLKERLMFWKPKVERDPVAEAPGVLDDIRGKVEDYGLGMRVYRTPCGYRGLVTSHTFDPTSDETKALLEAFGSDRLYIRMCRAQECFRARLTPKPYRMNFWNPPYRFPWITAERRMAYREWEGRYENACQGYSACRLVDEFGPSTLESGTEDIVRIHDSIACTGGKLA